MADNPVATPLSTSSDYDAMKPYWDMVETMLEGTQAMRDAGQKYLPKFKEEDSDVYVIRQTNAVYTNLYRDIIENLASKPFAKEAHLLDKGSSEQLRAFQEDIDSKGNHLHVFLGTTFFQGISDGITWILVDKMPVRPGATVAEEKKAGARPYWLQVPAKNLLAVYTATVDGKEQVIHARLWEPTTVRDGDFGEKQVNRVRVFNREPKLEVLEDNIVKIIGYEDATWKVYEESVSTTMVAGKHVTTWDTVDEGLIAIKIIPLVPFITGKRKDTSLKIIPPMRDTAYLQLEHYQQDNGLKEVKTLTCFPMLSASGVTPPTMDDGTPMRVPVGPRSVLFAPALDGKAGEWKFIEPTAESLKFLASDLERLEKQMRELGRQPLTAQSGNLTVIAASVAASKGNTAVQAWALLLKDTAEVAWGFTALWMQDTAEPEMFIHTDFAPELENENAPDVLLVMREKREISRKALITEMQRRSILSPEYDEVADAKELLDEAPDMPSPQDIVDAVPGARPRQPPKKPLAVVV